VNPEAGFFGVVPGRAEDQPTAFEMIQRDTLYTNVALRPDGTPWWEGHDDPAPAEAIDWQGSAVDAWHRAAGRASEQPVHDAGHQLRDAVTRVRESGRRADRRDHLWRAAAAPCPARVRGTRLAARHVSRRHAVLRTTAAATGKVGVLRRDPMAMWPFCGYNMGAYFRHWLDVGARDSSARVFRVNWFRTDANGKFMWPGFGDNLRVLKWILDRCEGQGKATDTVIGAVPTLDAIDVDGLVSPDGCRRCCRSIRRNGSKPWPRRRTSSRPLATSGRVRCATNSSVWHARSTRPCTHRKLRPGARRSIEINPKLKSRIPNHRSWSELPRFGVWLLGFGLRDLTLSPSS
jgi:hypothetical protein